MNKLGFKDRLTITNEDGDILRTTFTGSAWQKMLRALGSQCYCNDLITDAGLADVASLISDRYDYISVGTGTTDPATGDTTLATEVARIACSKSQTTTFYTNDTIAFTATYTPITTLNITESGLHVLATATGDVMLARETFAALNCPQDVSFTISWDIILMR